MKKLFVFVLFFGFLGLRAQTVTSLSGLQAAIDKAAPGAVIILADGVYTAGGAITISRQGTAARPIVIRAQTIGGAEITGTAGFSILSPASYVVIQGFKFTHSASRAVMAGGTSHCRWTHNLFQTPGDGEDLLLNGNDHEVDYNSFQHKDAMGRFIAVRGEGRQIAQRLHIHHNYFFDQKPQKGNGAETLQFGLSGFSLSNSSSIVEYNVFEECAGENELISVKASQLTIRYNTIRNCRAQFTLRHGNRDTVYGNFFINTPGLRIFGDDHVVFSNYFEGCDPAIMVGNGDGEVADGAQLTAHDRPDRVLVAFNTLVNNVSNIVQTGRVNGLGASSVTIANNIIQGGGMAAKISGPFVNGAWSGNMIFGCEAGDMPSGGYESADPLLVKDGLGVFRLLPGSPAVDHGVGSYPAVAFDMDGQGRRGVLDKGADEFDKGPVLAHILLAGEVGWGVGR